MKISDIILILCSALEIVHALRCYQCRSSSEELCKRIQKPVPCKSGENACRTVSYFKVKSVSDGFEEPSPLYQKSCARKIQTTNCDSFCKYNGGANCKIIHCCTTQLCNTESELILRRPPRSGSNRRSNGGSLTLYSKWIFLLMGIILHLSL